MPGELRRDFPFIQGIIWTELKRNGKIFLSLNSKDYIVMRESFIGLRLCVPTLKLMSLVLVLVSTCTAQSPAVGDSTPGLTTLSDDANARYLLVHLDTLDAEMQPIFEDTRREWVSVLNTRQVDDGRGIYLLQDGHTLVSVHAFRSFEELAALRRFAAQINERLGPDGAALSARYDAGDTALRSPHRTEIWEHDFDSDYIPEQGRLNEFNAGYMLVEEEFVASQDYSTVLKEIDVALKRAKYPLTRIVFYSSPGTGQQFAFWLAASKEVLEAVGTPYQAVARVLGTPKAIALFNRFKLTTHTYQAHEWLQRPDLNRARGT